MCLARFSDRRRHAITIAFPLWPLTVMISYLHRASLLTIVTILILLAASPSARAATEYEFTVKSEGAYSSNQSGRITVAGEGWRIDFNGSDEVRAHDTVLLARDGRIVALNHSNQTWYELAHTPALYVRSLFDFHQRYHTESSAIKIDRIRAGSGAFRYKTRFVIGGEAVTGSMWGRLAIETGPAGSEPSPMALLFSLATGTPATDQALHGVFAERASVARRVELTLNRQFDGATAMTQVIEWSINGARAVDVAPSMFSIPAQYRKPVAPVRRPIASQRFIDERKANHNDQTIAARTSSCRLHGYTGQRSADSPGSAR
jgi:hypothetical protein